MRRVELGIVAGLTLTVLTLTAGLLLEGGHLGQVLQPTAALVVLGGTWGAVLVQFPFPLVKRAASEIWTLFVPETNEQSLRSDAILRMATQARRLGIASLDAEIETLPDPFFRRCLMLAVDGFGPETLREIAEVELVRLDAEQESTARVWETAGGFAPTVGILGAVLGLIQVMERLDDLASVGHGIAVAFVATLYGVGFANLLFLPIAGKLRHRANQAQVLREMTLEGVLAILEGANTRTLRERLGISSPSAVAAR